MNILISKFATLVDIILNARREVIISLPNITHEQAILFSEVKAKGIDVTLYLEIEENAYRSGYGDFESLEIIEKSGITLYQKKKVNIYFYIIDDSGFFHFPKSRFTEDEGIAYDLFRMIPEQVSQVRALFKPKSSRDEIENGILSKADENVINEISGNINLPDKKTVNEMVSRLQKDPPKKPLLHRALLVYQGKFQVVELEFKGANLHVMRVKIPSKALPFKDAELQKAIETNLKLFDQLHSQSFMKPFFDFKNEFEIIRKKYLVHLKTRNKSFISKERIQDFQKEVDILSIKAGNLEQTLINELQDEISNTRYRIINNLNDFFRNNIPNSFEGLQGETLSKELNIYASKIVSKIKFPLAKEVLSKLKIEYSFYDITWESLHNKEMLSEMVEKGMISLEEKAHIESKGIEVISVPGKLTV